MTRGPMLDLLGTPASWLRVAVSTLGVYVFIVVLLRMTGNRTLASMRAYDFVLVVALGTLVSSAALTQVPLGNAAVAILLLVGAQVGVAWMARRSARVEKLITSAPVLVLHDGRFLDDGLAKALLTREEILLTLRTKGHDDPSRVGAVVLETNGDLSVLMRGEDGRATTPGRGSMENVPPRGRVEKKPGGPSS
jgi:uncharacterized membrane protein YcaP (DUF421 family)